MRRTLAGVLVFAVTALVLNANGVARVAERTTPDVLKPFTNPVLDVALRAQKELGILDVRNAVSRFARWSRGDSTGVSVADSGDERFMLAGDSVMENIVASWSQVATQWPVVATYVQRGSKVGDPFVEWDNDMADLVRENKVDVVVIVADVDASSVAEYSSKALDLARAVLDAGAKRVVWLERPITANSTYEEGRYSRREALREAARREPRLTVLDPSVALVSSVGGFSSYVVTPQGRRVRVRERDGVHLTLDGAVLVVQYLADALSGGGIVAD
jgi:hypothetical protein